MKKGLAGILLYVLVCSASIRAADPAKPWEWTLEERLAVRLDPEKLAKRQEIEDAASRVMGRELQRRHTAQNYAIEGSRNPELFLPHELFDMLLTGFVPDAKRQAHQRASMRPGIVAAGFDEEIFWAKLRSAASQYIDTYTYPAPGRSRSSVPYAMCRDAFLALNASRQVFGRETFDRLLYEVVAPGTQFAEATSAPDPAAELRFIANGCQ